MKKRIFSKISKSVVIAILAIALVTVGAIAAYQFTRPVGVNINVVPGGDLVVTPAELTFGDMLPGDSVMKDVTLKNQSSEPLSISWDIEVTSGEGVVLTVDDYETGFQLLVGQTITKSRTFTVPLTAPYGSYTALNWTVTGITS